MTTNAAAASSPAETTTELTLEAIPGLEQEILDFSEQRQAVMQQIRELRAAESRELGVHSANEIFMLQQEKLRLDAEVDFREKKIRRIHYMVADSPL